MKSINIINIFREELCGKCNHHFTMSSENSSVSATTISLCLVKKSFNNYYYTSSYNSVFIINFFRLYTIICTITIFLTFLAVALFCDRFLFTS